MTKKTMKKIRILFDGLNFLIYFIRKPITNPFWNAKFYNLYMYLDFAKASRTLTPSYTVGL